MYTQDLIDTARIAAKTYDDDPLLQKLLAMLAGKIKQLEKENTELKEQ